MQLELAILDTKNPKRTIRTSRKKEMLNSCSPEKDRDLRCTVSLQGLVPANTVFSKKEKPKTIGESTEVLRGKCFKLCKIAIFCQVRVVLVSSTPFNPKAVENTESVI